MPVRANSRKRRRTLPCIFCGGSYSRCLLSGLSSVCVTVVPRCTTVVPHFCILMSEDSGTVRLLPLFLGRSYSRFCRYPSSFFGSKERTIFAGSFRDVRVMLVATAVCCCKVSAGACRPGIAVLSCSRTSSYFRVYGRPCKFRVGTFRGRVGGRTLCLGCSGRRWAEKLTEFLAFRILYYVVILLTISIPSEATLQHVNCTLFLSLAE